MHDARFDTLAKLLVGYSIRLKRNENVLIEAFDVPEEMTIALVRTARNIGANPFVQIHRARVSRALALAASDRQLKLIANHELARMKKTDCVEIKGPGTELRFSIKGLPAVICGGDHNIPDGEVFSCPVKNSVQGHVTFNAPSIYQGISFDGIRLEFRDGKIVNATSNRPKKLNKILDSDAGARYIGEFSLGFNPHVLEPMRDILFDEKIAGSFHFTPGQAYEEADNGNRSQVHWDMVSIQRPEYGGGEIYFDDKLIRRDGEFLPKRLRSLNRGRFARRSMLPR